MPFSSYHMLGIHINMVLHHLVPHYFTKSVCYYSLFYKFQSHLLCPWGFLNIPSLFLPQELSICCSLFHWMLFLKAAVWFNAYFKFLLSCHLVRKIFIERFVKNRIPLPFSFVFYPALVCLPFISTWHIFTFLFVYCFSHFTGLELNGN